MTTLVRILVEGGVQLNPPRIKRLRARTSGLSSSWTQGLRNKTSWWNAESYRRLACFSAPPATPCSRSAA
jgi:hypothetical protein